MKKTLALLMAVFLFLFSGCSLPEGKEPTLPVDLENGTDAVVTAKPDTAGAPTAKVEQTPAVSSGGKVAGMTADEAGLNGRIEVTLYYQDAEGFLIPVTRWVEKQQGIARAAVNGLTDHTMTREELSYYGLYPVLPVKTQLLGISIKDGIAVVDFGKGFLDCRNGSAERNAVVSLVYTLTGFKSVQGVKILVNGYPQKVMKYGTDLSGVLRRDNILINASKANVEAGCSKADIYLCRKYGERFNYFIPVSKILQEKSPEDITPSSILRLLIEEESGQEVSTEIPQGSRLLGCDLEGDTLTVDLSREVLNYGGTSREDTLLKQILYTAAQVGSVTRVHILIQGGKAELPEGTEVSGVLGIPTAINAVME